MSECTTLTVKLLNKVKVLHNKGLCGGCLRHISIGTHSRMIINKIDVIREW